MKLKFEESNEIKERRKKQAIKVAITETLMVIAVVALVVASMFVAVGYNVNLNNEEIVERTGLLAIQTRPTGATVTVDGEQLFAWTNMSRTLSEGTHHVILSREKYGNWEKDVTLKAGMMYRLNYPRLFPLEMKSEEVLDFSDVAEYSVAPDENTMIVFHKDGTVGTLKINDEKPTEVAIDFSKVFTKAPENIEVVSWSGNSRRMLVKIDGVLHYLVMDKPTESVALTEVLGGSIDKFAFINDGGTKAYVLSKNVLVEIDFSTMKKTEVAKNVWDFSNVGERVAVSYKNEKTGKNEIGMMKSGETTLIKIREYACLEGESCGAKVGIDSYFGDDYLMVARGQKIEVLKGTFPNSLDEEVNLELIFENEEIGFSPYKIEVWGGGEVIFAVNEARTEAYSFETEKEDGNGVKSDGKMIALDENILYTAKDGKLSVFDFDGGNRREIVSEGVDGEGEVKFSRNDKWVYYTDARGMLVRKNIVVL